MVAVAASDVKLIVKLIFYEDIYLFVVFYTEY